MKHQIPAEALAAWDRGDRIDAIRLLREETGVGLKEAHDALASGAFHVTAAATAARVSPVTPSAPAAAQALAQGRLLDALRATRAAQAQGTAPAQAQAKVATEALPQPSDLAPGEVPPSRGWGWLGLVALGLLAWAGYRGWLG